MTEAMSESSDATDSVPDAGILASEAQSSRKFRVKIDGEELEVPEEELTRDYQKYRGADKRFQEAAELRKQAQQERELVDQFIDRATKGDLAWLKGLVPQEQLTKFAEAELLQHIEWQSKPEVERRAIEAERKAEQLESKVREFTQTKEREEASALEERAYEQVETEIVTAVKELGYDYKITPRFVRRIAEQLYATLEASPDDPQGAPIDAKTARDRAWKGLLVDAREVLSTLPAAEALQLLPPKLREAIRKADVEDAMNQHPMKVRAGYSEEAPARRSKLKRMSTEDYFSKMDAKFKD